MVGHNRTNARPTVMICSADEKNCKSAKKEIKKSGILDQNARFKVVCAAEDPGMRNMEQLAADENENNKETPAPLMYSAQVLMEKSTPIQPFGMRIWVDHVSSLRPSTAFVCQIKGHTFLRTVYHAFSTSNLQLKSAENAAVYVYPDSDSDTDSDSGSELGPGSEDSSEFNVSITSIGSRSPETTSDDDSRSDSPTPSKVSETFTFSSLPQACDKDAPDLPVISSEWKPSDNSYPIESMDKNVQPPRSSLIVLGTLAFWSVDKDWALIEISDEEHKLSLANSMAGSNLKPVSIAGLRDDVEVIAHPALGKSLRGTLSAMPLCSRLPNSTSFQDLYRVTFSGNLENGDCGSPARHLSTGELYGHVIAGSRATRMAYIMTASAVERDFDMLHLENWRGPNRLKRRDKFEGVDRKCTKTQATICEFRGINRRIKSHMSIRRPTSDMTRLSHVLRKRNFITAPFIVKANTRHEDLDRFLRSGKRFSLSRIDKEIKKLCEREENHHGSRPKSGSSRAWVNCQSLGIKLDGESIGPLSAVQFTDLLSSQRASRKSPTDSFRHLILIRTAWNYEARPLRSVIHRYLEKRASIRVQLPATNLGALLLELHLPYLALRKIPKVSPDQTTDDEVSNDGPWSDLSFLEIDISQGESSHSYVIHKFQMSLLVCAWDSTKWAAYSFTNSVLKTTSQNESHDNENGQELVGTEHKADMDEPRHSYTKEYDFDAVFHNPTWNPVIYYLVEVQSKVQILIDEWTYLLDTVAPAIQKEKSLILHEQPEGIADFESVLQHTTWITAVMAFLRNLRKMISDTSRAWERFRTFDTLSHLQEFKNTDAATTLDAIKLQFTRLRLTKMRLEVLHDECGETERLIVLILTRQSTELYRQSNKLNRESISLNRESIRYSEGANSISMSANVLNLKSYRIQNSAAKQSAKVRIRYHFMTPYAD